MKYTSSEFAVETFSLTKVFSDILGRGKVAAVDKLNLKINYNEVFGLLGPNGSGKTTTLKMLLGLLYPTKGKALLLGGESTDPKISARIGFLPEESYLYRYLTARETLDFYGRLFSLPRRARKGRIEELLDMVGLRAAANRPVGTFSKGMARRIGLAQALINDPDLLILDEPTTGLDPTGTRQIKDLILELAKRGKTILLCSHLLADVEDVCDRIAILYGGRIQSEGRVRELLQQSQKRQITTDLVNEQTFAAIEDLINKQGAEYEITAPMEKLEDYFIKIVAQAERQAAPISGVVVDSAHKISEFLRAAPDERSRKEAILERLISAPETEKPAESITTQRPQGEVAKDVSRPDNELLESMTGGEKNSDYEPPRIVKRTGKAKANPRKKRKYQPDENILKKLIGEDKSENTEQQQEDRNSKNE